MASVDGLPWGGASHRVELEPADGAVRGGGARRRPQRRRRPQPLDGAPRSPFSVPVLLHARGARSRAAAAAQARLVGESGESLARAGALRGAASSPRARPMSPHSVAPILRPRPRSGLSTGNRVSFGGADTDLSGAATGHHQARIDSASQLRHPIPSFADLESPACSHTKSELQMPSCPQKTKTPAATARRRGGHHAAGARPGPGGGWRRRADHVPRRHDISRRRRRRRPRTRSRRCSSSISRCSCSSSSSSSFSSSRRSRCRRRACRAINPTLPSTRMRSSSGSSSSSSASTSTCGCGVDSASHPPAPAPILVQELRRRGRLDGGGAMAGGAERRLFSEMGGGAATNEPRKKMRHAAFGSASPSSRIVVVHGHVAASAWVRSCRCGG